MKTARGYRLVTNSVLAAILLTSLPAESQTLPNQVQADIIYAQISEAIRLNKASDALVAITQYRALGVTIPPTLLFVEAKLAALANEPIRADTALSEYLRLVNSTDASYAEAIKIYPEVHRRAEEARQVNLARERLAVAKRVEQEKMAAKQKEDARNAAETARWASLTPEQRLAEVKKSMCESGRKTTQLLRRMLTSEEESQRRWKKAGFGDASRISLDHLKVLRERVFEAEKNERQRCA